MLACAGAIDIAIAERHQGIVDRIIIGDQIDRGIGAGRHQEAVRIGSGLDRIVSQCACPRDQLVGPARKRPARSIDPSYTRPQFGEAGDGVDPDR